MASVIEHMVYTKIKEMNTGDNVHEKRMVVVKCCRSKYYLILYGETDISIAE